MKNLLMCLTVVSFLFISCDEKNERGKTMDITKNKTIIQVLENIKVGDDIKDASKYLDSIKLGHGIDTEKSAMLSMVRNIKPNLVSNDNIQIIFYFDTKNKITKIETKSIPTGL